MYNLTKMVGGGTSWYYLLDDKNRVCGAAHEMDKDGMAKLIEQRDAQQPPAQEGGE